MESERTTELQDSPSKTGLIGRWFRFMQERFEPIGTTLMIFFFYSANAIMAYSPDFKSALACGRSIAGFVLIWLVFFHMRLFDEVKDYSFDVQHNPKRPLARGLIGLAEFGAGTLVCILLEAAIASNLGWQVLVTYSMLLAFTLLMRVEFFVGDWLKPKLELYAMTHTFSASFMGILIFSVTTSQVPFVAEPSFLLVALGNWFVFNVFEFGRKTFGKDEEKGTDDSYSFRRGPKGAVILLLVNLAIALVLLGKALEYYDPIALKYVLCPSSIICALVFISGLIYAFKPNVAFAKLYRGTVTFYLLGYHIAIAVGGYLTIFR